MRRTGTGGVDKGRLEAFSDGVPAINLTITVLELHVPHGADLAAMVPMAPKLFGYALSIVFVAIDWNNHHHMLHAAHRVSGPVLWANLRLLFRLSLTPWVTAWMGEYPFMPYPAAAYGAVLLMSGLAYSSSRSGCWSPTGVSSARSRRTMADRLPRRARAVLA